MLRSLKENGIAVGFGLLFVLSLAGQGVAGHAEYNNNLLAVGGDPVPLLAYLTSSTFAVDVTENWQSEYLQFFLYIFATVWLVQRGSPESKPLDSVGTGSDEQQQVGDYAGPDSPAWARVGGWRTFCSPAPSAW